MIAEETQIDDFVEICIESKQYDNNIKIKYDSEIKPGETVVKCDELDVCQTDNTFKCSPKYFNKDACNTSTILIMCSPLTKVKLNLKKTSKNIKLLIDSNSPEILRSQTIYNSAKYKQIIFNSAEEITKYSSDIEIFNITKISSLSLIDSIGASLLIDSSTSNKGRRLEISYTSSQKNKVAKLFIGSFKKDMNTIDFDIKTPQNLIINTNNDKVHLKWDRTSESNFAHIQTLEGNILCISKINYIHTIIKDIKELLKPIIEQLVEKEKIQYLKQLSELAIAHILHNTTKHIEAIQNKGRTNLKALERFLQINKVHKTILVITDFVDKKIPKSIISADLLKQVNDRAIDFINNQRGNSKAVQSTDSQNTKQHIKDYFVSSYGIMKPIQSILGIFSTY